MSQFVFNGIEFECESSNVKFRLNNIEKRIKSRESKVLFIKQEETHPLYGYVTYCIKIISSNNFSVSHVLVVKSNVLYIISNNNYIDILFDTTKDALNFLERLLQMNNDYLIKRMSFLF